MEVSDKSHGGGKRLVRQGGWIGRWVGAGRVAGGMMVSVRACLAPHEALITVTLRARSLLVFQARCEAPGGPPMMPTQREVAEVGPEQVRVCPMQVPVTPAPRGDHEATP